MTRNISIVAAVSAAGLAAGLGISASPARAAFKVVPLACETTSDTSGPLDLGGAVTGYLSFGAAGLTDGDTAAYQLRNGTNRGEGLGTYNTGSPNTFTRDVNENSTAGLDTPLTLSGDSTICLGTSQDLFTGGVAVFDFDTLSLTALNDLANVDAATESTLEGALDLADLQGDLPLGAKTSGNYAAGDAEAGAALTGDSATAFFLTGTIEADRLPDASTSAEGIAELATSAEADARSDTARVTTPASLANFLLNTEAVGGVKVTLVTSSSTHNFDSKMIGVWAIVQGAGGAGGGADTDTSGGSSGGGGESGGTCYAYWDAAEAGANAVVAIGAAGTGNVGGPGNDGGDTTANPAGTAATATANGGDGGDVDIDADDYSDAAGGSGEGTFSNCDFGKDGDNGDNGWTSQDNSGTVWGVITSGAGGTPFAGRDGSFVIAEGTGFCTSPATDRTSTEYGGGGHGMLCMDTNDDADGANGGPGVVVFIEYLDAS